MLTRRFYETRKHLCISHIYTSIFVQRLGERRALGDRQVGYADEAAAQSLSPIFSG